MGEEFDWLEDGHDTGAEVELAAFEINSSGEDISGEGLCGPSETRICELVGVEFKRELFSLNFMRIFKNLVD